MHVGNHIWAKSYGSFEIILAVEVRASPLKEGEGLGAEVRATDGAGRSIRGRKSIHKVLKAKQWR